MVRRLRLRYYRLFYGGYEQNLRIGTQIDASALVSGVGLEGIWSFSGIHCNSERKFLHGLGENLRLSCGRSSGRGTRVENFIYKEHTKALFFYRSRLVFFRPPKDGLVPRLWAGTMNRCLGVVVASARRNYMVLEGSLDLMLFVTFVEFN